MNEFTNDLTLSNETTADSKIELIFEKKGRQPLCKDENKELVSEIIFPINQIIRYADDSANIDDEIYQKNLNKAKIFVHDDFGSDSRKTIFFDMHIVDSVNSQKIYVYNEFALVICKVLKHDDKEEFRSYKLISDNGEYKFFKMFDEGKLEPGCMKYWALREKIELQLE